MKPSHDPLASLRKAPGIVRLHGHRGARGIWPENTMFGFKNTLDLGVRVVELDILLTRDEIPVVTHNPTLMAATTRDEHGLWVQAEDLKISDFTFEELRRFDVGGIRAGTAYGARYPEQAFLFGQAIPSFTEVLQLVGREVYKDVWLNIEIKSTPLHPGLTPPPAKLAHHVVHAIQDAGLQDRVIVQSFDWRVLREVAQIAPALARSHLTYLDCATPVMQPNIYADSPWMAGTSVAPDRADLCDVIAGMGGKIWSPFHEDITAQDVARAQALGLIVNAWTVNEIGDIDRVLAAGVDGIITDYPARVQRRLLERGLRWHEGIGLPC